MTQEPRMFHSRRAFLLAASAAGLASCAKEGAETEAKIKLASKTYKMGERAAVGLLTYNILEANYYSQLGEQGRIKMPEKRFLIIRLSITNGGAAEAELPLFRLIDGSGAEIGEVQQAEFIPGWMGMIRKVGPTQTEEGRILFDVSPKPYKLEITDGAEPGKEQTAYVEIPIDFETSEGTTAAPQQGLPQAPTKP